MLSALMHVKTIWVKDWVFHLYTSLKMDQDTRVMEPPFSVLYWNCGLQKSTWSLRNEWKLIIFSHITQEKKSGLWFEITWVNPTLAIFLSSSYGCFVARHFKQVRKLTCQQKKKTWELPVWHNVDLPCSTWSRELSADSRQNLCTA